MFKNVITIQEDMLILVEAFHAVTHPVWDFLLGWLFLWLNLDFPWWLRDYLTLGVISVAANTRMLFAIGAKGKVMFDATARKAVHQSIFLFPLWPLAWFAFLGNTRLLTDAKDSSLFVKVLKSIGGFGNKLFPIIASESAKRFDPKTITVEEVDEVVDAVKQELHDSSVVFFEFFLWAIILIAVNYALFWYKGA